MNNMPLYELISLEEQAQGWAMQCLIHKNHPLILDHKVQGLLMVSGAYWIQCIGSFMAQISNETYQIDDLIWLSSLTLDEATCSLSFEALQLTEGTWAISLYKDQKKLVQTLCKPLHRASKKIFGSSIADLWPKVKINLDHQTLYAKFSSLGFDYGPSYALILHLGCTSTWSIAQIDSLVSHEGYNLDPGKIDAGLQSCLGIAYANQAQESLHLPFSIKSIKAYDSLASAQYIYVVKNIKITKYSAYHLFFLNEEGILLTLIQDFIGRKPGAFS